MTKNIKSGYPNFLIYFMWKWQVHYMISCKVKAESLFNKIDHELLPTAFLIGIRVNNNLTTPVICFEPEKMEFLAVKLKDIEQMAIQVEKNDPRRSMRYTGEGMQEEMDERRRRKYISESLKILLDTSASFNDKIHFVSIGVMKGGYEVFVILQLKKSIYLDYVFLKYKDPEEYLSKYLSFIDAAIDVHLNNCVYDLHLPEPGRDRGPDRDSEELLREAAKRFLSTVGIVGNAGAFHSLFPVCNTLSVAKYENKENKGHIIVCRDRHPAVKATLAVETTFSIWEIRKLRKLLELTTAEIGIITNGDQVFGLGKVLPEYDRSKEDIFDIYFRGLNCYEVMHQEQILLMMRYAYPEQLRHVINRSKFSNDAKLIFIEITEKQIEQLYLLSLTVAQKTRGCMLVFANDAASEAKRLDKQCITIKPTNLDTETIIALTSIDGALIIDLNCNIHAKGAILDGVVGLEGDSSRGSRYNSALTYCEYRGWSKPTMIIVVSEDGMVDVIPNLMPSIRHSEILQFIVTLENLNTEENFNDQAFYNTMDLLKARSFYLTAEECNHINALKNSLEEFDKISGKMSWRTFDNFQPNPRMNSRFYINEA